MDLDERLGAIREEASQTEGLVPYLAVNGLWLCLVKTANLLPRVAGEHEQTASLLRRFTRSEAVTVIENAGVRQLVDLDPPLETVRSDEGEGLVPLQAQKHLARIRERRSTDPKAALAALFEVLQTIRDKREHAFKTPKGARDTAILGAATSILKTIVAIALTKVPRHATARDDQHRSRERS